MFLPGQAWVAGFGSEYLAAQLSTARRRQRELWALHARFPCSPTPLCLGVTVPSLGAAGI